MSITPAPPAPEQPLPARRRGPRPRAVASIAAAVLATAGTLTVLAPSGEAATAVTVTVNASSSKGTVPAAGNGVNMAVWDGNMNTAASADLLSAADVAPGYQWTMTKSAWSFTTDITVWFQSALSPLAVCPSGQ